MRAVIYARLSKVEKKKRTVESIESQIAQCMAWAREHGYEVIEVFRDNLTASRFSKKDRPDFVRMMQFIPANQVPAVLVTEQARLDRKLWEIIDLIQLAHEGGLQQIVKVRRNEIMDLSTEKDLMRVIDQALRDREESTVISERVRARKLDQARAGEFPGGRRPFGWEADGVTPIQIEQNLISWVGDQILAGVSLTSLTRMLNRDKVPTAYGGRWQRSTLQFIFRNKRIIGIRVHHGVEYKAQWDAVIEREMYDRIQIRLDANQSRRNSQIKSGRRYLLTGFVVCGLCGNHMTGSGHTRAGQLERRYYCQPEQQPGIRRGCGKIARLAEPVEAVVIRQVLYRLDSPEFAEAFATATQNDDMQAALAEYQETKTNLGSLLRAIYTESNPYSQQAMEQIKGELESRLEQITHRMDRIESVQILAAVPFGKKVTELWDGADQSVQRDLIRLLLDKVVIQPSSKGGRLTRWTDEVSGQSWMFDPSKVELHWKV
jgi:site-specific DNA recombinase